MLAILKYVVIKSRIFSAVARQLALTWQAICTQIVVRGLKCYHILAVYICALGTLTFHQNMARDWEVIMNISSHYEFIGLCVFEICGRNVLGNRRFHGNHFGPLVGGGSSTCHTRIMKLIVPPKGKGKGI